jgi:pyridoxal 5'-phosphate synthase pdxT subunit
VRRPHVGVLALQGDTREHLAALRDAGADASTVRRRDELDAVDALVIPGGESTAMSHLLRELDLLEPLRARLADGMPAYGSCAGMILLADEIADAGVPGREALPLGGLDITVRRNAFGRQVDSFEADLDFARDEPSAADGPLHAVFIRAPAVEKAGSSVEVLASVEHAGEPRPVAVRSGPVLATAFHPELTSDRRVHDLFVHMVLEHQGPKREGQ